MCWRRMHTLYYKSQSKTKCDTKRSFICVHIASFNIDHYGPVGYAPRSWWTVHAQHEPRENMLGPRLAGGRCGYWCAPARLHMQPVPGGGAVACGARTLDWPCALRLPLCCGHVQSRPSANVLAERLAPHAQVPRLDPLLLGAQARGRLDDDAKAPARASMPTDCLKVFGLQVG